MGGQKCPTNRGPLAFGHFWPKGGITPPFRPPRAVIRRPSSGPRFQVSMRSRITTPFYSFLIKPCTNLVRGGVSPPRLFAIFDGKLPFTDRAHLWARIQAQYALKQGILLLFLSESQVMDIFVQKVPLKLGGAQLVQKCTGSGAKLPKRQFRFPFGGIHPTEVKMTSLRAANVQKARTICLYLKSRFAMAGTH